MTMCVMLLSERRAGSSPKLLMGRYERTEAFRTLRLAFSTQSQTEQINKHTTDNLRLLESAQHSQLKEHKELLAAKQHDLKMADGVHHGPS